MISAVADGRWSRPATRRDLDRPHALPPSLPRPACSFSSSLFFYRWWMVPPGDKEGRGPGAGRQASRRRRRRCRQDSVPHKLQAVISTASPVPFLQPAPRAGRNRGGAGGAAVRIQCGAGGAAVKIQYNTNCKHFCSFPTRRGPAGIEAAQAALPRAAHVAVFDTAFHQVRKSEIIIIIVIIKTIIINIDDDNGARGRLRHRVPPGRAAQVIIIYNNNNDTDDDNNK